MITVYTLPNCVQCDSTKRMLDRNGIQYDIVDLSKSDSDLDMIKSMGYQSAPVVFNGDEHWGGFRIDKLNALVTSIAS